MSVPANSPLTKHLHEALDHTRRQNAELQDRIRGLEGEVAALKRTVFLLTTDPDVTHGASAGCTPGGLPIALAKRRAAGVGLDTRADTGKGLPTSEAQTDTPATVATEAQVQKEAFPGASEWAQHADLFVQSRGVMLGVNTSVGPGFRKPQPYGLMGGSSAPEFAPFVEQVSLKSHKGPVYAVRFSPDGSKLVSASFDKSAVVWPVDNYISSADTEPLLSLTDAHRAAIVAVEWTHDSSHIITGAFDASAAQWDIATGAKTVVRRFYVRGMANAVAVSPASSYMVFVATARSAVHMFDLREPARTPSAAHTTVASSRGPPVSLSASARGPYDDATIVVDNDAPIGAIHLEADGVHFLTGDQLGAIKSWDLRMRGEGTKSANTGRTGPAALLGMSFNDDERRPITHIHSSPRGAGDDNGRLLAVNSYTNYLKVYDRGSSLFGPLKSTNLKLMHSLRGVVNRNWPIKSSFFVGPNYRPQRAPMHRRPAARNARALRAEKNPREAHSAGASTRDRVSGPSPTVGHEDDDANSSSDSREDMDDVYESSSDEEEPSHAPSSRPRTSSGSRGWGYKSCQMPLPEAMILASGSADGNVLLFDVGGAGGTAGNVQTIRAHKSRVHAVDFHPSEPILASCSADSLVKLWAPQSRA